MQILIYGDSNTWGQIPNINAYSKDAVIERYNHYDIWWDYLTWTHDVVTNGLPGRAICKDSPWLKGRNALSTIDKDLSEVDPDLIILQLGTNDCKSIYNLTPNEITSKLESLAHICRLTTGARVMIISPPKIKKGNKITDKFYRGAEEKTEKLDALFAEMAQTNGFGFVSGLDLPVGEDGEHLTLEGHQMLGKRVVREIEKTRETDRIF